MTIKSQLLLTTLTLAAACGALTPAKQSANPSETAVESPFVGRKNALGPSKRIPAFTDPASVQVLEDRRVISTNTYKSLKVDDTFKSAYWKPDGWTISHYYLYKVKKIENCYGVYDNFLGDYYSRDSLTSGAVQADVEETRTYSRTTTQTMSFSWSIGYEETVSIGAKLEYDGLEIGAELAVKTGTSYSFSNSYTWSSTVSTKATLKAHLGPEQGQDYCPIGYSMSLGHYGSYTVITVTRREYESYWWGDYPVGNSHDETGKIVESDEGAMDCGYIYHRGVGVEISPC